jgi:hypothetical protein
MIWPAPSVDTTTAAGQNAMREPVSVQVNLTRTSARCHPWAFGAFDSTATMVGGVVSATCAVGREGDHINQVSTRLTPTIQLLLRISFCLQKQGHMPPVKTDREVGDEHDRPGARLRSGRRLWDILERV